MSEKISLDSSVSKARIYCSARQTNSEIKFLLLIGKHTRFYIYFHF